jgi:hypothetical protein
MSQRSAELREANNQIASGGLPEEVSPLHARMRVVQQIRDSNLAMSHFLNHVQQELSVSFVALAQEIP